MVLHITNLFYFLLPFTEAPNRWYYIWILN